MSRTLIQSSRTGELFSSKERYFLSLRAQVAHIRSNDVRWRAYRSLRTSLLQIKRSGGSFENIEAWFLKNQKALLVLAGSTKMTHSEKELFSGLYKTTTFEGAAIVRCEIQDVTLCKNPYFRPSSARPYYAAQLDIELTTFSRPRLACALQMIGLGNTCEASGWARPKVDAPLSISYSLEINMNEWPALAAHLVWKTVRLNNVQRAPRFFKDCFPGIAWPTLCGLTSNGFTPCKHLEFSAWLMQFRPGHEHFALDELPDDLCM
jgi:hypothetical protein